MSWDAIVKEDRAVQEAARDNPECFDEDTMELMKFIEEERIRRAA